jgi:hypothetical protein
MGCCQSNNDNTIVKNEHGMIVMTSFDNKRGKSNGPRLKNHSTSTEDAVSANLDVTRFTIFISRIKGRNLVPKDVTTSDPYVVFKWDGGNEFKTAVKKYTLNPVWDDYFQFCFECNVSDLNGKILAIDVYDYNSLTTDQSIGYTNIPINTISTGPVHYDVALKSKKKNSYSGRLSFNIVMEQIARWPIVFKGVRAVMNHQFLNHTLDSNTHNDEEKEDKIDIKKFSGRSFTFQYDFTDQDHNVIANKSPIKKQPDNPFGNVWTIIWKGNDIPAILSNETTFSDILSSTIRVVLVDTRTYFNKKITVVDDVWGQCWLQMNKLYSFSEKDNRVGSLSRKTQFEESLWFRGKKVGYIEGIITFKVTPSVGQLVSGVMTEDGVKTASPVVVGKAHQGLLAFVRSGKENKMPKEASTLGKLLGKMPKLLHYRRIYKKNIQKGKLIYYQALKNMLNLIRHTHKDSMISFLYESNDAKQSTQELFISIGNFFMDKLESRGSDFVEQRFIYRIVLAVLHRSELADLSLLGFDPVAPSAFDANNNLIDNRALDVAVAGRALLVKALSFCISKLRFEGKSDETLSFTSHIFALSIFRLPLFGEAVVQSILSVKEIDLPLPEWEGSGGRVAIQKLSTIRRRGSWSKDGSSRGLARNRSFLPGLHGDPTVLMLDWQSLEEYVAEHRKNEVEEQNKQLPKSATMPNEVKKILKKKIKLESIGEEYTFSNNKLERGDFESDEAYRQARKDKRVERLEASWVLRMHGKKRLFYLVCGAYMEEIFDRVAVVKSNIQYHKIPFFPHVLKAFLLELKQKNSQGDALIRLSRTMLVLPGVMDTMVKLTFNTCHVRDLTEVSIALAMVRSWIVSMGTWHNRKSFSGFTLKSLNRLTMDSSFDFHYFFAAIKILLSPGNPSQVTVKGVEFLYSIWDTIPQQHAEVLVRQLLEDGTFGALCLHWEREVRHFFAHLVAFRILQVQGWSGDSGSPSIGYEEFLEDDSKDPFFYEILSDGSLVDGADIEDCSGDTAKKKISMEDDGDEFGRISFDFDTTQDKLLKAIQEKAMQKLQKQGSGSVSSNEKVDDVDTGTQNIGRKKSRSSSFILHAEDLQHVDMLVYEACAAIMRHIRREMLNYEENREKLFGASRLDADFKTKDMPENCVEKSDSETGLTKNKNKDTSYASEFSDAAKKSRIHPLPGGESIEKLYLEETVNMDQVTLSGSGSGLVIPSINLTNMVYAKHACQEYAQCAIEAEALELDIRGSGRGLKRALSVPALHFHAVVKDHGEIRSALKVNKTSTTKL